MFTCINSNNFQKPWIVITKRAQTNRKHSEWLFSKLNRDISARCCSISVVSRPGSKGNKNTRKNPFTTALLATIIVFQPQSFGDSPPDVASGVPIDEPAEGDERGMRGAREPQFEGVRGRARELPPPRICPIPPPSHPHPLQHPSVCP